MTHRIFVGVYFVALATPAVGQTVTENFEGGIPATWTIQDNFPLPGPGGPAFSAVPWTTNDAEGMLNYTAGTGLAATASSFNHEGQYDISLITPTFLITPGIGSTLRYTINYYRVDAFEAFDTNLSLNGGPWMTMTHDTMTLGSPYGLGPPEVTRTLDLGFFGAALGDSARVEFRYFSTFLLPMVHNQYVEIDDVRIPTPIPEPASLMLATIGFAAAFNLSRQSRRGVLASSPTAAASTRSAARPPRARAAS